MLWPATAVRSKELEPPASKLLHRSRPFLDLVPKFLNLGLALLLKTNQLVSGIGVRLQQFVEFGLKGSAVAVLRCLQDGQEHQSYDVDCEARSCNQVIVINEVRHDPSEAEQQADRQRVGRPVSLAHPVVNRSKRLRIQFSWYAVSSIS